VKSEPNYVVTEDKWMRVPGGILDENDKAVIKEAGEGAIVINVEQMFQKMKETEPEKFEQYKKNEEEKAGKSLTIEDIIALGKVGNERFEEFKSMVMILNLDAAIHIRQMRLVEHRTWRSISRAIMETESNQIFGMALCWRAAIMMGEDFEEDPWN